MPVKGNEDHKQRVNLSGFAISVIDLDRSSFGEGSSLSGFLNRIITCFRDSAEASVDLSVRERKQQLLIMGYAPEIVEQLTREYREQVMEKMPSYPRGDSLIFRLNKLNFRSLYEEREESTAYSAPSKYIKGLLEEYARLSPSEREEVYYKALIREQLEPALTEGNLLEIRVGGKDYLVRAHSIMADPYNSHLYLVGISRQADKPEEEQTIASFRITRLEQVKRGRQKSKLTLEERRLVDKQLQQSGVQYLVGTRDQIKVRLTPAGRRVFLQRSYMRPVPEDIRGDVYRFNCTPMQARNYFLSFGKEAEILEPASLRKEFMKIYREAAKLYE